MPQRRTKRRFSQLAYFRTSQRRLPPWAQEPIRQTIRWRATGSVRNRRITTEDLVSPVARYESARIAYQVHAQLNECCFGRASPHSGFTFLDVGAPNTSPAPGVATSRSLPLISSDTSGILQGRQNARSRGRAHLVGESWRLTGAARRRLNVRGLLGPVCCISCPSTRTSASAGSRTTKVSREVHPPEK